jgi:uridine kinase
VKLLKYRPGGKSEKVSIYQCGPERNHFYGYLVPGTGYLKIFDLIFYPPGFILLFPTEEKPLELPPFVEQEKMFQVFQEYEEWAKILGLETVALLNDLIVSCGIGEFIKVAEALHEKKIAYIADQITHHSNHPRIVLIGGPSCSGKTTFSKRLCIQLRVNGFRPVVISTDDFFVDRDHTPRDEEGNFDFEAFEAIDYQYLNGVIRDLFKGKTVQMPKFDFSAGSRKKGEILTLARDQIIILEGIHSLNDRLLSMIPEGLKFKIYVSALTTLNIDYHNRISTSDSRLLRRIVRDSQFRNYSTSDTLSRWPSVRRGEARNIFPYQENADVMFNSALMYEIAVLKKYIVPRLREIERSDASYPEACRLLKFISYFLDVEDKIVPRHSILREFIGGSSFVY